MTKTIGGLLSIVIVKHLELHPCKDTSPKNYITRDIVNMNTKVDLSPAQKQLLKTHILVVAVSVASTLWHKHWTIPPLPGDIMPCL